MATLECIHIVLVGLDKEWNDKHIFVAIYLRTLSHLPSSLFYLLGSPGRHQLPAECAQREAVQRVRYLAHHRSHEELRR